MESPPQKMRYRLITQKRLELGLWSSATPCQRCLMVLGGLFLAIGCWMLSANENIFFEQHREFEEARAHLRKAACEPHSWEERGVLRERHALLHLEGCTVHRPAKFSEGTTGLEDLRYFKASLPNTPVEGLWFKIHLEQYSKRLGEWYHVDSARNLGATTVTAAGLRVGGFAVVDAVLEQVPGQRVTIKETKSGAAASFENNGPLTSDTMHVMSNQLYSGDPVLPRDGDVRVWFSYAQASTLSILAGVFMPRHVDTGVLEPWHAPTRHDIMDMSSALVNMPGLAAALPGSIEAHELLEFAVDTAQLNLWPPRIAALVVIWLAMSFILFPNHVVPDLCGKCCWLRSMPPTIVTALIAGGASWGYFNAPRTMSAAAVLAVPLLLTVAAGYVPDPQRIKRCLASMGRRCLRKLKKLQRDPPWSSGARPEQAHFTRLPSSGSEDEREGWHAEGGSDRMARSVALGAGVAIVIAGPVVKALAVVDVFGFYYYAASN